MKFAYFFIPSFVMASATVGAAIATVNQQAQVVQPKSIASISLTPSTSSIASPTPTLTASTPDRPAPRALESAQLKRISLPEPLSSRSLVTIEGIGAVRVGMNLAQAEQAAGVPISVPDTGDNGCDFVQPQGIEDVLFMVTDDQIARVDVVRSSTIKTLSGAGIGNTTAEIEVLYPGQIKGSPHEYIPGAHYLTYVPNDPSIRNYRIVFETDANGVVTRFRSGKLPEVTWTEGCF